VAPVTGGRCEALARSNLFSRRSFLRMQSDSDDPTGSHRASYRIFTSTVLIALTARPHGARLITSNRSDFELIRSYRSFQLESW
jgi:predicted nucleic acid-binding protein